LREKRVHSAIVTGQLGKAVGLITIQDVLGELLGTRGAAAAGAGAPA
jgi:CBS domain containing-hemolysin-like protein